MDDFENKGTHVEDGASLTLQDFQEVLEALLPVLYYHPSKFGIKGRVVRISGSNGNPEFVILHSEDVDHVKSMLKDYRTMKPLDPKQLSKFKIPMLVCKHGKAFDACSECVVEAGMDLGREEQE